MENIEIQGMSRGAFLVRGALATSAVYGAAFELTARMPGGRTGRGTVRLRRS